MTRTTTLLFLLLIAAAIWLSWRHYANAKALLQDWAAANGLRILHAKSNALWLAMPLSMWFTTSKYQMVYRISAYDETTHRIRNGLVRLGTPIWGLMNPDAVEVFWDGD
ncbi:hypothetical protein B0E52_14045 [Rhodanobacter sp. C06]|uniref:hypothetical protein n=1 Tax=Rhodanobacter sp. C06 TaxID=1945854 RepID=UPI0009872E20|nr:hypothetical protein [Rhodanobacter sp. C06]OOG38462.1 hypothetical protein B0E52_14045 [Rhodanobacter sp. C06]